jgi:hypothetical protein
LFYQSCGLNAPDFTALQAQASMGRRGEVQAIRRLPAFAGGDKPATLAKKRYFCDNGIASVLATISEGAAFENAICNQLWPYGGINYLAKGSEYEVDFILTREERSAGLEVKYHPIQSDDQKLKRFAAKHGLGEFWLVGKYPTPGFSHFILRGDFLILVLDRDVNAAQNILQKAFYSAWTGRSRPNVGGCAEPVLRSCRF